MNPVWKETFPKKHTLNLPQTRNFQLNFRCEGANAISVLMPATDTSEKNEITSLHP
ncbi:MAG: hypothetical protein N2747_07195 [Chitinophagaceae bacterium]|nr:hypothetical protein [Chitinophagaceae bacterium]